MAAFKYPFPECIQKESLNKQPNYTETENRKKGKDTKEICIACAKKKEKNSRTESKVKVMSGEIWANEVKVSRTLLTGLKLTGKQNVMLAKNTKNTK